MQQSAVRMSASLPTVKQKASQQGIAENATTNKYTQNIQVINGS